MPEEAQANFKRWFGESRVRNNDGTPRKLFHGTRADIHAFDMTRLGHCVDNPTTRFGFYFTADPEDAQSWAQKRPRWGDVGPAVIMPVYLRIEKPVVLSPEDFQYYLRKARATTIDKHLQQWVEKGHDGIFTQRDEKDWFVAFKPDQIKSAIGNRTFAPGPDLCDLTQDPCLQKIQSAQLAQAFLQDQRLTTPRP